MIAYLSCIHVPPAIPTPRELAASPSFQGLFQFNFEEALTRYVGKAVDVRFTQEPDFSFADSGDLHSGRFHGLVDSPDGPGGETTGTFRLHLPNGLEARDPGRLLDQASLEVAIDTLPAGFA